MKVVLFGRDGKVGSVLGPRLVDAGHEVLGIELGEEADLVGYEAAVDFTAPAAVLGNARSALVAGLYPRHDYSGPGNPRRHQARDRRHLLRQPRRPVPTR